MDQILNKVGSYWFNRKATKQLNSVGDDINVPNPSHPFSSFFIFFTELQFFIIWVLEFWLPS